MQGFVSPFKTAPSDGARPTPWVSQLFVASLGHGEAAPKFVTNLHLVTMPWLVVLAAVFNLVLLVAATSFVVAAVLFAVAGSP